MQVNVGAGILRMEICQPLRLSRTHFSFCSLTNTYRFHVCPSTFIVYRMMGINMCARLGSMMIAAFVFPEAFENVPDAWCSSIQLATLASIFTYIKHDHCFTGVDVCRHRRSFTDRNTIDDHHDLFSGTVYNLNVGCQSCTTAVRNSARDIPTKNVRPTIESICIFIVHHEKRKFWQLLRAGTLIPNNVPTPNDMIMDRTCFQPNADGTATRSWYACSSFCKCVPIAFDRFRIRVNSEADASLTCSVDEMSDSESFWSFRSF